MKWQNISDKTIRERQPNKWLRCEEGDLALVPRSSKTGRWLGPRAIMLLERLIQRYQIGQIFSYQDIAAADLASAQTLGRLWRCGYLDKYALGEWGGGWRGKYAEAAGKYWGVHYSLTQKVKEIERKGNS